MNSLWNFDNGFPIPQATEFPQIGNSWVPVTPGKPVPVAPHGNPADQNGGDPLLGRANWPEMSGISNGYLHEIPNLNIAGDGGLFGFDFGFSGESSQTGAPIPGSYTQDLGIGSTSYGGGSLSDILALGDAAFIPSMEESLQRSLAVENAALDLNFPAVSNFWPEFSRGTMQVPNQQSNIPAASILSRDYSGNQQSNNIPAPSLLSRDYSGNKQGNIPAPSLLSGDYSGATSSRITYDLNLAPRKELDVPLPVINSHRFAPETPNQVQLERQQLSMILNSLTEETVSRPEKEDKLENSNSDELLQNIVDSFKPKEANAAAGNDEAIDLNKTPQQKTPKRRKHRPKVVVEGKPKRAKKTPNTEKSNAADKNSTPSAKPSGKRKYVRRKGVTETPSQQPDSKDAGEDNDGNPVKTCRRALNFDLEDAVDATSVAANQNITSSSRPRPTESFMRSNISLAEYQQGHTQWQETVSPQQGTQQHRPLGHSRFYAATAGTAAYMGGQNSLNRPHTMDQYNNLGAAVAQGKMSNLDNGLNSRQVLLNSVSQAASNMVRERQQISTGMVQSSVNSISIWQRMLSTFPGVQQNRIMPGEIGGRTASLNQEERLRSPAATNRTCRRENSVFTNAYFQAWASQAGNLHQQQSSYRQQFSTPRNEETSVLTQIHDSTSTRDGIRMAPITPEKREMVKDQNGLVSEKNQGLSKPKSTPSKKIQQQDLFPKSQYSATGKRGSSTAFNYAASVDQLTNRLKALDLNAEAGALVPYKGDGSIVPYEVKKRKQRPKVDLDPETNRIWNLLMGNDASAGLEENNPEKEKWWQAEREVFRGRADSFIARMHLVQGDRRFSRWKGSVVDSVIGVFLTQNVSDHLSSSAFMALVAKFPVKSTSPHGPCSNSKAKILVEEPGEFILNTNKLHAKFLSACNQSPVTVHSLRGNWRDCISSPTERNNILEAHSQSTDEEAISSQGSSETPADVGAGHKSEGVHGPTSNHVSENGYSQSNYERCEHPNGLGQERVDYTNESPDDSYPPGFENQHFHVPSVSSNLHQFEMNSRPAEQRVEGYDVFGEESTSSSSKRLKNSGERAANGAPKQTVNVENNQIPQSSSNEGSHSAAKSSSPKATEVTKTKNGKAKGGKTQADKKIDWDLLRRDLEVDGQKKERSQDATDSLDYEAIRKASVKEISDTIKERGMNNLLAERIKNFLDRLVEDHGSIDLEWLRNVAPDKAKDYLLSIRGLGLKSVECVRLLTLHHLAFPVDTNVGRIAVRLGWVPLEPLPESLQLHLLELYPMLESIQKYLWPRLCKLDQRTLYELHYQLITFGKVFCTKTKPNCNACPMRAECRHFASAFASARLALPGPEEKKIVSSSVPFAENTPSRPVKPVSIHHLENNSAEKPESSTSICINPVSLHHPESNSGSEPESGSIKCQPIIEEPATPEEENCGVIEHDIEESWFTDDDDDEIPTINLNVDEFRENLEGIIKQKNGELDSADISKALVALDPALASVQPRKLKSVSRLRTEHQVYELPDDHPLLEGMQKRELDDPSPYLLAIWTAGETANSTEPPKSSCQFQDSGKMCSEKTCFSCNSIREADLQIVRGTILIPCRTAMKGSFPLNGTYFQVNEMFADHKTSTKPIHVHRDLIWNLRRRIVYFGTSVTSIFKGLTTEQIQHCFWRGFVCVRGFDRETGAPRPLVARLHFTASKQAKVKNEERNN